MPSKRKEICLRVRVPESVFQALSLNVMARRNGRDRKNVSRVVCDVLDRALDRGHRRLEDALLRQLTETTVRVAERYGLMGLTGLALVQGGDSPGGVRASGGCAGGTRRGSPPRRSMPATANDRRARELASHRELERIAR
jgi:hypothetical protein